MMWKARFGCLALALIASGCAFHRAENRPLTTALDRAVVPESRLEAWAIAPVMVPAGAVTLLLDVTVLHPMQSIPRALEDTYDRIWAKPVGTPVTQGLLFLPKVAVSPVFFAGRWFARSWFDVRPREKPKQNEDDGPEDE